MIGTLIQILSKICQSHALQSSEVSTYHDSWALYLINPLLDILHRLLGVTKCPYSFCSFCCPSFAAGQTWHDTVRFSWRGATGRSQWNLMKQRGIGRNHESNAATFR